MLDDARRADVLKNHPREDLALGLRMQRFAAALQDAICRRLERCEPTARFSADPWEYHAGRGGGLTRVIEGGAVWEKGGVNTSAIYGDRLPLSEGPARPFFATGISLVLHPRSPHVPTVHANFRYFALGEDLLRPEAQWFGGGADLTPCYPVLEDVQHFHRAWQQVCARHGQVSYAALKAACDAYFYLPHRGQCRGVGGIFYDRLDLHPEDAFHFTRLAGRAFLPAYLPIAERRRSRPYGEPERRYQAVRRSRYAEFNLAYDRGTRFGLETGGRTESILMSLPPTAAWPYDWRPEPGSAEEAAERFLQPADWLGADALPSEPA